MHIYIYMYVYFCVRMVREKWRVKKKKVEEFSCREELAVMPEIETILSFINKRNT